MRWFEVSIDKIKRNYVIFLYLCKLHYKMGKILAKKYFFSQLQSCTKNIGKIVQGKKKLKSKVKY